MGQLSIETIERGLKDDDWRVRAAAMKACEGKDVPLEIIERGLRDDDCDVRAAAMKICEGKDVPLEIIERWLKDSNWRVRAAAMKICEGKDVPLDIIERGLRDDDCDVRAAAMKICKERGYEPLPYRTIEPPARVYKKCLGNVIVVAEIPSDAEVRGSLSGKCRTNKAHIVDIIGDLAGERVGVSMYDLKTLYFIGDDVNIENFDLSDVECSTGFHFFCTREAAEAYN